MLFITLGRYIYRYHYLYLGNLNERVTKLYPVSIWVQLSHHIWIIIFVIYFHHWKFEKYVIQHLWRYLIDTLRYLKSLLFVCSRGHDEKKCFTRKIWAETSSNQVYTLHNVLSMHVELEFSINLYDVFEQNIYITLVFQVNSVTLTPPPSQDCNFHTKTVRYYVIYYVTICNRKIVFATTTGPEESVF